MSRGFRVQATHTLGGRGHVCRPPTHWGVGVTCRGFRVQGSGFGVQATHTLGVRGHVCRSPIHTGLGVTCAGHPYIGG